MAKSLTVLVVDDEPPIRRLLRTTLAADDYRVVEADNAAAGLRLVAVEKPDLVILDLGLPDRSGLELIGEIRATSRVPIVVLSARHDERSKVEALDLGADDYVAKPFGMAELLARMRAALRHAFQAQGELPAFVSGDLTVDLVRRHVTRAGQEVKLSPKEFDLLRHLVMHAGKVLTHRQLLREVWGPAQADEVQYLRVFIRGLRAQARTRPGPADPHPDRVGRRLPAPAPARPAHLNASRLGTARSVLDIEGRTVRMDLLILPAVEADFTLGVQPSVTVVVSPKDSDFVVAVSIIEQVTDPIIAPLPD